jgi:hypothetical protein
LACARKSIDGVGGSAAGRRVEVGLVCEGKSWGSACASGSLIGGPLA